MSRRSAGVFRSLRRRFRGKYIDSVLPIGLMLGVGYLTILFLPQHGWIAAGALTAVALVAQAVMGARATGLAS